MVFEVIQCISFFFYQPEAGLQTQTYFHLCSQANRRRIYFKQSQVISFDTFD